MPGKRDLENRIRVSRLLGETGTPDDLRQLLQALRSQHYGAEVIKDIGDFSAHMDERVTGRMREDINSTCLRLSLVDPRKRLSIDALPAYFPAAVRAYLDAHTPDDVANLTGLKPQRVANIVGHAIKVLKKKPDGTLDGSDLTDEDRRVLFAVCGKYAIASVYDADHILSEFVHAVVRNGYASDGEIASSTVIGPRLSVFAFAVLHRSSCRLTRGEAALAGQIDTGRGRMLSINATFPLDPAVPQLRIGFDVFQTRLAADQHCSPELLSKAQHANGLVENPAHWEVPIEVGSDWLLHEMR